MGGKVIDVRNYDGENNDHFHILAKLNLTVSASDIYAKILNTVQN